MHTHTHTLCKGRLGILGTLSRTKKLFPKEKHRGKTCFIQTIVDYLFIYFKILKMHKLEKS